MEHLSQSHVWPSIKYAQILHTACVRKETSEEHFIGQISELFTTNQEDLQETSRSSPKYDQT